MTLHDAKVLKFLDDAAAAGIRNPVSFLADKMAQTYGWLKGAFPRNGMPTDVDGSMNVGMKFLWLEFKPDSMLRDGKISKGQALCFERLVATKMFTIFYIGKNDLGECTVLHIWGQKGVQLIDPCNERDIWKQCRKWSDWALKEEEKWWKLTAGGTKPHCLSCLRPLEAKDVPVRISYPDAVRAASPDGASRQQPLAPDGV